MRKHERTRTALLALGRHGELVPEAERVVRQFPLRERPRAQLMLALYRSGRQADALSVYGSFRRQLLDEVGLEPSAELRRLHQDILQQDVAGQHVRTAGAEHHGPKHR
jgi:DNA-binding SARP family transcriptional activator